ncbi:hypothetical protein K445DRAFT_211704 [Daldinia sp. EC12]|nr:hypothetical protein K445DRAFT_211704 [Daldinia sp. EC12]
MHTKLSPPLSITLSQHFITRGQASSCSVYGDDNLYGLGVRLGSYLQWLSLIVAYHYCPRMVAQSWVALNTFRLGMLATILWKLATLETSGRLYNIDVFISLVFGAGGGLTSQTTSLITSSLQTSPTMITSYLSAASSLGFAAVGIWFWFVGIYILDELPCKPFVFFFSRVYLLGWFVTFSEVTTLLALFVTLCNTAYRVWHGVTQIRGRNFSESMRWLFLPDESASRLRPSALPQGETGSIKGFIILTTQIITLVFFVLMIELALFWSHVEGVNTLKSTGQVIPLITGLAALFQNIAAFTENRSER